MQGFFEGIGTGILFLIALTIVLSGLGFITMAIWNAVIPDIFNLPTINFLQGIGLNVLSYILFNREVSLPSPVTFITDEEEDN